MLLTFDALKLRRSRSLLERKSCGLATLYIERHCNAVEGGRLEARLVQRHKGDGWLPSNCGKEFAVFEYDGDLRPWLRLVLAHVRLQRCGVDLRRRNRPRFLQHLDDLGILLLARCQG